MSKMSAAQENPVPGFAVGETRPQASLLAATDSGAHGRHGSSHCVLGRPSGHAVPRELAQFTKVSAISAKMAQNS